MALSIPNPLTQMMNRWAAAMPGSRRNRRTSVTALDVEDGWLHVLQAVARGGQTRIVRHGAAALTLREGASTEDASALGEAVRRALEQLRFKPGPVIMGVPRAQAMLRRLELPPAKTQAEIASMVYLQVNRDLPFRLEEALLDFKVLPQFIEPAPAGATPTGAEAAPRPAPSTNVLAAVVRRETVEYYQTLAGAAGLKLTALGLRSVAARRVLEFCHREAAGGCAALVSIRKGEVVFDVLRDGALVFSRVGAIAGEAVPEDSGEGGPSAAQTQPVVLEVVRSLHSYESAEGHQRVARFFVTGTTGAGAKTAAALSQRFGVPAQVLDAGAALAEVEADKAHLDGALPAIGLALEALDPAGLSFDFLNPKRPPVQRDYRRVRVLASAAGSVALVMAVAGLRAHWLHQRERQRDTVKEEATLAARNLAAFRVVRAEALALRAWHAGNRDWLDQLALLSALLPHSRDLYVTALSTSARNTLSLGVRARSSEIVDSACSTLRTAGYQVRPPAITPISDRYGYGVQANLELVAPAKLTNDLDHLPVESRPPPQASLPPQPAGPQALSATTTPPAPTASAAVAPAPPAPAVSKDALQQKRARRLLHARRPGSGFHPNQRRPWRRRQRGGARE